MVSREFNFSIEDVIHYHLDQIRKWGKGWRTPQVREHRNAVIALIKMRRRLRWINKTEVKTIIESDGSVIHFVTHR